jgi:site-specific DNA recombinase
LIDSYTEGLIEKPEFEPRLAELRRRLARFEAEASEQQTTEEQVRSLQRVIGKLDLFATMVRDRLATADWATQRDIICTLVKRIEVASDVVRVVFRVDPSSSAPPEARQRLPHCPTRRDPARDVEGRRAVPLGRCCGRLTAIASLSPFSRTTPERTLSPAGAPRRAVDKRD